MITEINLLRILFQNANIAFTNLFLKRFFEVYKDQNIIKTYEKVLAEYEIPTMKVKIDKNQLKKVDLPIIALLKKLDSSNEFTVIKEYQGNKIVFQDSQNTIHKESIDSFNNKWTGIALLTDFSNAKEPSLSRNKKIEKQNKKNTFSITLMVISLSLNRLGFDLSKLFKCSIPCTLGH